MFRLLQMVKLLISLIKAPFRRLIRALSAPRIRFSSAFSALSTLGKYSPKEEVLRDAMKFASSSRIPGDYLEFGVKKGGSFSAAYHLAQRTGIENPSYGLPTMHFYAFDSFKGLPEITETDEDEDLTFQQGDFAYSKREFVETLRTDRVDLAKVTIVPGWYKDVLNKVTSEKLSLTLAAVIYIDCDLYTSTVCVLDFIAAYVQDGTVLIFDDWYSFRGNPNRGQQRAFGEWLTNHPEYHAGPFSRFGFHGHSFIMSINDHRQV